MKTFNYNFYFDELQQTWVAMSDKKNNGMLPGGTPANVKVSPYTVNYIRLDHWEGNPNDASDNIITLKKRDDNKLKDYNQDCIALIDENNIKESRKKSIKMEKSFEKMHNKITPIIEESVGYYDDIEAYVDSVLWDDIEHQ